MVRPLAEALGGPWPAARTGPVLLAAVAFVALFAGTIRALSSQMWNDPDAGHGLLLVPVALWLAWQAGIHREARPNVRLGSLVLGGAVLLRALGGLAAEFFTQRFSIWLALIGLTIFVWGLKQVWHWWLPITLLVLAIPLPATITNSLAIPLQFQASRLGTKLIAWREIEVQASGNVINIVGFGRLFVAEACSGLRSLTALISIGVMMGGMWLTTIPARVLIVLLAVPVAIVLNGIRIFMTGFLMYYISPEMGQGFMHTSEGWALFVVALLILGGITALVRVGERAVTRRFHD
jgi:exosortase